MAERSSLVLRGKFFTEAASVLREKLLACGSHPIIVGVSPSNSVFELFAELVKLNGMPDTVWHALHVVFINDIIGVSCASPGRSYNFAHSLNSLTEIAADPNGVLLSMPKRIPLPMPLENFHHQRAARPSYAEGILAYEQRIRGLKGGMVDLMIASCDRSAATPLANQVAFSFAGIASGNFMRPTREGALFQLDERDGATQVLPTPGMFRLAREAIMLAPDRSTLLPLALYQSDVFTTDACPLKLADGAEKTLVLMPPLELVI